MRQQHEITTSGPLLGSDGNLLEPGWARSLLPVYRRADIKAGAMRIKEWDYYLITDGHIGLALTIADNSYVIQRPFVHAYVKGTKDDLGLAYLDFLKTDKAQELIESEHLVPVEFWK